MAFHRRDVLARHEKVHVPDPSKRRRRPRRGTNPKPFTACVQVVCSETNGINQDNIVVGAVHDSVAGFLVSLQSCGDSTTLKLVRFLSNSLLAILCKTITTYTPHTAHQNRYEI
jgi:hypothetical protein